MSNPLVDKLHHLQKEAENVFLSQNSEEALYEIKVKYLGKKGRVTEILKDIGTLPNDQKPLVGKVANEIKVILEDIYNRRIEDVKKQSILDTVEKDRIDVSLPGDETTQGAFHPITQTLMEMKDIFRRLGFDIHDGPEIESDYYNFEALNIPKDHPSRDMQDTFYLEDGRLLRTHTSPVQVRVMEKSKPPIRMVAGGAVYRCDSDVSHSPMFHQIEGLVVDEGINFSNLKAVLEIVVGEIFGRPLKVKLRPSFFPFTEPSAEVDIECVMCEAKGCRVCKSTGWLEIMGCGMVDPEVFKAVKIDPEIYQGFAFGIGIERVAMLKYGINDIRLFYENDYKFLRQFI